MDDRDRPDRALYRPGRRTPRRPDPGDAHAAEWAGGAGTDLGHRARHTVRAVLDGGADLDPEKEELTDPRGITHRRAVLGLGVLAAVVLLACVSCLGVARLVYKGDPEFDVPDAVVIFFSSRAFQIPPYTKGDWETYVCDDHEDDVRKVIAVNDTYLKTGFPGWNAEQDFATYAMKTRTNGDHSTITMTGIAHLTEPDTNGFFFYEVNDRNWTFKLQRENRWCLNEVIRGPDFPPPDPTSPGPSESPDAPSATAGGKPGANGGLLGGSDS
jgi:hypothetical protein